MNDDERLAWFRDQHLEHGDLAANPEGCVECMVLAMLDDARKERDDLRAECEQRLKAAKALQDALSESDSAQMVLTATATALMRERDEWRTAARAEASLHDETRKERDEQAALAAKLREALESAREMLSLVEPSEDDRLIENLDALDAALALTAPAALEDVKREARLEGARDFVRHWEAAIGVWTHADVIELMEREYSDAQREGK
ncbi:MAG: hypothetical protein KGL39_12190 [Patescibacteria group bacterium]|nr:hypothetical protein [Patescibacteria group bacterium]